MGGLRRACFSSRIVPICLSKGEIEPVAPLTILDIDDPKVRIEIDLALQTFFYLGRLDPFFFVSAQPEAFDAMFAKFRLRRRRIKRSSTVQAIDFDEYRPRFRRASPPQRCNRSFDGATPQIPGHPDIRAKAHGLSDLRRRPPQVV
jgi:hypothetical protein